MAAGLSRSFWKHHWLPPVGVEYNTELNGIIQEMGLAEALVPVRSAARIDFDNALAVNQLLDSARASGDGDTAVWALAMLVRLSPEDVQLRSELVSELLTQGRVIEAYPHAQVATRLSPDSAQAYCNLGAALLGMQQMPQAAAAYRRALELDGQLLPAREALDNPLRGY
jgi:Flp pilus assembly protein TadD